MLPEPFLIDEVIPVAEEKVGLAVLGQPINHSISPILHHAALKELLIKEAPFSDWHYDRIDIHPDQLHTGLEKLKNCGYKGLNLTIPHKEEVLSVINHVDAEAEVIGAVNTLLLKSNEWIGFNTDGYGIFRAVQEKLNYRIKDASVLLLGAGGAARAACVKFLMEGCSELKVLNRSEERMNNLVNSLKIRFNSTKISGTTYEKFKADDFLDKDWLVVNATSIGLDENDLSPLPFSCSILGSGSAVYDMIYNPVQTKLLEDAEESNLRNANGLSMLVFQAAKALEIWTEREVSTEAMFLAAYQYLSIKCS